MSAHTPGPWETSSNADGEWDVCMAGGGDLIADIWTDAQHREHDANLIAQAPAMLDELRALVAILEGSPGPWQARMVAGEQNQWVATLDRVYAILATIEGK